MNQEKFELFSKTYRKCLEEAVIANPAKYLTKGATPDVFAETVSKRMLDYIGGGKQLQVAYDSDGFKRTCKALGIKHTRKAILSYLEIRFPHGKGG